MKNLTNIVSRKKHGFALRSLHTKKEPHPVFFLSQRTSFWIATLSIVAFAMGNMVGQHGWYLFWASVLGKEDIVYTGTVPPIAQVPIYSKWSQYGGDPFDHSFRQVPQDVLQPLPLYTKTSSQNSPVYSVSFMGTYFGSAEGSGSHPGVDIRVPIGTPVVAIANGIVDEVKSGGGFGNVITIRHPNVPDPENPRKRTTLTSVYAHLDSVFVTPGIIVTKGEQIGTSGMTGFASGPHLHFQIDRESAPWHPYWPFSTEEQHAAGFSLAEAVNAGLYKERGFQYTVSPLLYVQSHHQLSPVSDSTKEERVDPVALLVLSVEQRRQDRLQAAKGSAAVALHAAPAVPVRLAPVLPVKSVSSVSRILYNQEVVTRADVTPNLAGTSVSGVRIRHDGSYSGRGWETITVQLVDANGTVLKNPLLKTNITMRSSYGEAEFRPSTLTPLDFVQGQATVHILPLGRRTVVLQAWPFAELSSPMVYQRQR